MNKSLILAATIVASLGFAPANASEVTNSARLKVTSKLIGAGLTGCAAAVGFEKLSPQISSLATGAVMVGATVVAARLLCGADINISDKAINLPVLGKIVPEVNWFNVVSVSCASAAFGLYKHSDKLVRALDRILSAAA